MDQIVLEPEPKKWDAWSCSRSPKFEFRLRSPALVCEKKLVRQGLRKWANV